ncbi:hypothetical protein [Neobacillus cucumis]|uniref:hypothetical protein n=1 Tax=Neobacillus cucumis TaxID=1740721 RepID=UPI00285329F6|nr:hypothetical protein [Neobacillus cucumis]MDR4950451.1 hypothetical protein [Neobacillus cucumis]
MAVNFEKMTAEIDIMDNSKIYVVKDGQLIVDDFHTLSGIMTNAIQFMGSYQEIIIHRRWKCSYYLLITTKKGRITNDSVFLCALL